MSKITWKSGFFVLAVVSAIALWLSMSKCSDNNSRANYFFDKFLGDSAKLVQKENELGQMTSTIEAYELTGKEMDRYVKENDMLKKQLDNKYSEIRSVLYTKTETRIDTIRIPVKGDSIPCKDFELNSNVNERYYSLDFSLKNKRGTPPEISILNLSIPDSVTTVLGTKKSGFLRLKRTLVAEQVHSNPNVKVSSMNIIVKKDAKPKTFKKVAIGIGIGLVGGYLIFK